MRHGFSYTRFPDTIPRRDQQRAVSDHLGKLMHYPIRIARVLDTRRQTFRDFEPLLDRRQQQYAAARGQPAAVEPDMYRLARDWRQTRQNPRTFLHSGRELRWRRLIRPGSQIIHDSNGLWCSRRPLHAT
jgi:hypothetical protein